MNFLKLLRCYWKQPAENGQLTGVTYYVQYERVNHLQNPIYEGYGQYTILAKHEDEIDRLIFEKLYEKLNEIPGIKELHIYTDELIVYGEFEEKYRAICSRSAHGHEFRDLRIKYTNGQQLSLSTRVFFLNASEDEVRYSIVPLLPTSLSLSLHGPVDTLISADFLDKEQVDRILELHDFNFSETK